MQAILASHQRGTMQRMKAQSTVLFVQDGTELNYSGLEKARDGHAQRDAHVNLRDREVELRPPSKYPARKALRLWVVHVHKPSPPAGAEPI
jgi:hypothetical protein